MNASKNKVMKTTYRIVRYRAIRFSYFLLGMAVMFSLWYLISLTTGNEVPGPVATMKVLGELLMNPFYDNGPNDKGIGKQLWSSLVRVTYGFGLGSLVAIPLGIAMGSSKLCMNMLNPMVQILRPVSPLAWFPIGLMAFQSAATSTIFVIFITSLWPTLINTAFGVSSIPNDHKNVAKVFGFSTFKYVFKILIPYSLSHILTGLRLSIGVAWMVIVAAEMLSGGIGIGFFVWESWNALSLERVISAILIIGLVGLWLDKSFNSLQKRFTYDK
jgi:nitrate/nitrite transport system permease protein